MAFLKVTTPENEKYKLAYFKHFLAYSMSPLK
ncbi:hypothetical protein CP02DC14_1754, partial [Chlamydia psittaci 02DC14]